MRALVTGGKGFIGGHLCDALRARKYRHKAYDLVDGLDVLDTAALDRDVRRSSVVFDCAGILGSAETFAHAAQTVDVNVKGTLNVLEACRAHNVPLIYLSLKNAWHNPYMITKRAATEFCQMYGDYYGLRVAVVRGLNAYGPGQHWGAVRKVVPTFIMRALRGEPLTIYGDGRQIVDLIHARDLVEIMVRCWEREAWGAVVDAGTGVPVTVLELARLIISMTGSASEIVMEPMRIGEPEHAVALADPTDAKRLLDYYPTTALREGMADTIEWYREHGESAYHG